MKRYLIKRVLMIIPMLIVITFISYLIMDLAPGDPSLAFVDFERQRVTKEFVAEMREKLGLNQPFYIRYFKWLSLALQGNLGYSLVSQRAITWEISQRVNVTLLICLVALVLEAFIGIAIGIVAALHHGTWLDTLLNLFAYISMSIPYAWICLMLISLFTLKLGWLPSTGLHDLMLFNPTKWEYFVDLLKHMILPILCMIIPNIGSWARFQRGAFLDAMNQDYVRTARAKGLSEKTITWKHILKNASLPTITSIASSFPTVITGSVMIESVFGIPGLGGALSSATSSRDYPMAMASLLITGLLTLAGILISDIMYALVDPRIRYQ
jgi:peptide/nickel transport system permease protein